MSARCGPCTRAHSLSGTSWGAAAECGFVRAASGQARRIVTELQRITVLWEESWVHTLVRLQPDVERSVAHARFAKQGKAGQKLMRETTDHRSPLPCLPNAPACVHAHTSRLQRLHTEMRRLRSNRALSADDAASATLYVRARGIPVRRTCTDYACASVARRWQGAAPHGPGTCPACARPPARNHAGACWRAGRRSDTARAVVQHGPYRQAR